jgi:hypothetical protein
MPCCTAAGAGLVLSGDLLNIAYDTCLFEDERVRLHAADALLRLGAGRGGTGIVGASALSP